MKKRIVCGSIVIALLCFFCTNAVAVSKPSVELLCIKSYYVAEEGVYGRNPTLIYRNNSQKVIKYLEFYITAYNRVGDSTPDALTGEATKRFTVVGPIAPFSVVRENNTQLYIDNIVPEDNPFRFFRETPYFILVNEQKLRVYQDAYNNFFVKPNIFDGRSYTYLTENQIEENLFSEWCDFENIGWYSRVVDHFWAEKLVITYMDGQTETIYEVKNSPPRESDIPFSEKIDIVKSVYNYKDYLAYNPDLVDVFSTDQKRLLEHFVLDGVHEGRRGSIEFDLETYKNNNPDLVAQFGDENIKYYDHYLLSGKREGRIAA